MTAQFNPGCSTTLTKSDDRHWRPPIEGLRLHLRIATMHHRGTGLTIAVQSAPTRARGISIQVYTSRFGVTIDSSKLFVGTTGHVRSKLQTEPLNTVQTQRTPTQRQARTWFFSPGARPSPATTAERAPAVDRATAAAFATTAIAPAADCTVSAVAASADRACVSAAAFIVRRHPAITAASQKNAGEECGRSEMQASPDS